jgi:enediyne polyketide synthase
MPKFLANPCESAPELALPPENVGAGLAPAREGVNPSPTLLAPAVEVVRQLVAEKTELPVDAIQADSRLLSDLHLNSISVGQLVAEAARRLGLQAPASPTDFSRATVAEVAEALEHQSPRQESAPAGVDSWIRAFQVEWVPRELPRRRIETGDGSWRIVAPPGHPLALPLAVPLSGDGVLLCLPRDPDENHAGLFLEAARLATTRLLVVGDGGGFARTFHLERPEVATRVVDVPFEHPDAPAWVAAEAACAESGYGEARYDASGRRTVPVLRPLPELPEEGLPLGPADILLVTGGGKGIGAECALDLARATGARLALLGRSRPEDDPELAGNLERMPSPLYVSADVTDPESVSAAVRRIESELGPVTALLHAAGSNAPCPISSLDEEAFRRTLAPKVGGLKNVLAALDPERLRLLVSFGSIIGRAGLEGEADYATANDWLALLTERFGREHPGCRCLTLEWSVWSGVGMGERLGTLESLIRRGITPIPPEVGVARLRDLLSRPISSSVVVAGRFGEPPTLEVERPELPLLRFLEKPRVFYPGIELVVDTVLSADTDPHLADHVFRGEPLFAAVLGLEAMAQAAMALLETREVPVFEEVDFRRPVAVPPGRSTTIRVAALVRGPGRVEVALRDAATGFAADCFRAVCRFERAELGEPTAMELRDRLDLDPADLYGGLLFHRGRFQRVDGYRHLRATECLAEIAPDGTAAWFGRWLPNELVLGDPGARDAAIHGIQACIPHAVLLPTGVDRIVAARLSASEPFTLAARERSRQGDDFVYDLEVLDWEGRVAERWEGLRLHAVERIAAPGRAALIGPYVERRLQEILPGSRVRIALEADGGSSGLHHRPDGRPEGPVSRSHAGTLVLSVEGEGRLGCDLEPVAERSEETWRDLLGDRFALAELIARETGEAPDSAATRVWAAVESLKKAGAPPGAPLTFENSETDGWLLLRSGNLRIGTWLGPVRELDGPAALAVLVEGSHADL